LITGGYEVRSAACGICMWRNSLHQKQGSG
jgi:hypothetical protein